MAPAWWPEWLGAVLDYSGEIAGRKMTCTDKCACTECTMRRALERALADNAALRGQLDEQARMLRATVREKTLEEEVDFLARRSYRRNGGR